MKIAFLSFYSGHVPRGIETFVHELANRLTKNNEVIVCQCAPKLPNSRYKTKVIQVNIDWAKINELRHLSTILFFDFNFKNFFRRFYLDYWSRKQRKFAWESLKNLPKDIDIVVSVGSGWISFFARLWCWKNHKKLVISAQSGPGWDDRINLLCRPDSFITLTTHQTNWAQNNGFGVKVTQIPNGVDLKKFNPRILPIKINLPRPIFLCVAALEPGKRIELTIKAVAKLAKGSLLVLGQGKLKNNLEKLAAELLPGQFQITVVPHGKIAPYYIVSDVVTMVPPLTESFGIVFLEAMACNKPVVASDDSPRREIIGDAGFFVDPENTEQYAVALKKALEKDWGDIPRKQAEKFSWDKIAEQYEELFQSL